MPRIYHTYILANVARRLYVGMTNDIVSRLRQHRGAEITTHVGRYGITRLVHAEPFTRAIDAIAREKQLKAWTRAKKLALVETHNPQWRDLSEAAALARMLR